MFFGEIRKGPPPAFYDVAEAFEGQPVTINSLANDREGSDPIDPSLVAIATSPRHKTREALLWEKLATIAPTPSAVL
jgi:hypothetical protein